MQLALIKLNRTQSATAFAPTEQVHILDVGIAYVTYRYFFFPGSSW
jgi:hypothetical protein